MLDLAAGFPVDDRLVPWGATPAAAAATLGLAFDDAAPGWQRLEAPCRAALGLATAGVEIAGHGRGRPVTSVRYDLAGPPGDPQPDPALWVGPLTAALGPPRTAETYPLHPGADPADCAHFNADWPAGEHAVSLSLFGAPRAGPYGPAAGALWLTWADAAAARPFLAERRARAAELAAHAAAPDLVTVRLTEPQQPRFGSARTPAGAPDPAQEALTALAAPDLLPTPPAIGGRLGTRGVALWRAGDLWGPATQWETVVLRLGEPVVATWHDVRPAKGGGMAEIEIADWRVRDVYGSRGAADLLAALATVPGVRIRRLESHDC